LNLYILVEGLSEVEVYPLWLEHLLPNLTRVNSAYDVTKDNYYIFSGGGIPSILNEIAPSVEEIKEINKFDYFIIALDADELSVSEREQEVLEIFSEEGLDIDLSRVVIIVQNPCFESWLLGNIKFFPTNITTLQFQNCKNYYDVSIDDPEEMTRDTRISSVTTTSKYHEYYLKKMFLERNQNYYKGSSTIVGEEYYLAELIWRADETNHLKTFKNFIDKLQSINKEIVF
jgi:hypothetical protein